MSITDELRTGGIYRFPSNRRVFTEEELTAIADRIDEEHEAACAEAYGNGVMSVPIALDESQWVKLPVDADGVPIHIGDELDVGFVARIVITDDEWPPYLYAYKETPHILTQHFCNEVSHHHAPTVEDVLTEFANRVCNSGHQWWLDADDTIAEYAVKLRLAGDAE